jgi:Antitoxin VbhA
MRPIRGHTRPWSPNVPLPREQPPTRRFARQGTCTDERPLVTLSPDVRFVDYPGVTRLKGGVQVTELQKAKRRVKAIRAIRRSSELEGARSTDATRADQVRYARGSITAAQLGDRVRRRYNVK